VDEFSLVILGLKFLESDAGVIEGEPIGIEATRKTFPVDKIFASRRRGAVEVFQPPRQGPELQEPGPGRDRASAGLEPGDDSPVHRDRSEGWCAAVDSYIPILHPQSVLEVNKQAIKGAQCSS